MSAPPASAADLGLDLHHGGDQALFGWFLASYLFGNRISQAIAAQTWAVIFRRHGVDSLHKLGRCPRGRLVAMLNEGRYSRYDESTASRLLEVCGVLQQDCAGSLGALAAASGGRAAFEQRLLSLKGVGPKTLEIFMREAGPVLFPQA